MCSVYKPREREREREGGVSVRKAQRESERKGVLVGWRHARQGGELAQPIIRQSCYVTGEGGAEENRVQTSEICCTDTRTSRIPNEGRIPRKMFRVQTGHIPSWTYSKVDIYQGSSVLKFFHFLYFPS